MSSPIRSKPATALLVRDAATVHDVKATLDWLNNQPYCPEDLLPGHGGGKCPGEDKCPGLRHKTAAWVVDEVLRGIDGVLDRAGYCVVPRSLMETAADLAKYAVDVPSQELRAQKFLAEVHGQRQG